MATTARQIIQKSLGASKPKGITRYNWNIVESGVKHHKTKPNQSFDHGHT
jgi:hypothetical protein